MAFSIISKPGSKYGPCKKACKHTDCKCSRELAEAICPACGDELGYENPFFSYCDDLTDAFCEAKLWHQSCLETYIEIEREKKEIAAS